LFAFFRKEMVAFRFLDFFNPKFAVIVFMSKKTNLSY